MKKPRPKKGTALDRALTWVGSRRARSILANPRIMALQGGSGQLYFNEAAGRYITKPVHVPKEIRDSWAFWQARKAQQGSTHAAVSEHNVRRMWMGEALPEYTMYGMHKVDITTVGYALNIAYNEMSDTEVVGKSRRWWKHYGQNPQELRKLGINSPEFLTAIHDRATYLDYMTQPMFFPESRNLYLQKDEVFMKEVARFRAFTDQLLRNNSRQVGLWRMGEIGFREMATNVGMNNAFSSFWYNGLKWVFMMSLYNTLKSDEDKKEMDFLFEALVGPLTWIPFLGWTIKGGINKLVHPDSYGPSNFSTITIDQYDHFKDTGMDIALAMKYLHNDQRDSLGNWKSDKHMKRAMRGAAEDTLVLLGLPIWPIDLIPEQEDKKPNRPGYKFR